MERAKQRIKLGWLLLGTAALTIAILGVRGAGAWIVPALAAWIMSRYDNTKRKTKVLFLIFWAALVAVSLYGRTIAAS